MEAPASSWWPFCPSCGSMLQLPSVGDLKCGMCGWGCPMKELAESFVLVTRSPARAPPAWLLQDEQEDVNKRRARVDEACVKCNHPWTYFYTMQMRSADEGQTVFYECPNCAHRWSQNN